MKGAIIMATATNGFGITYTDNYDRPTQLTPAEIEFFQETVAAALNATGLRIHIWTRDHEQVAGHENALGIYYGDRSDPTYEFITIDNYFIHERYKIEREGYPWVLVPETLLSVICHELAHMGYRYHNKYHAALTQLLLDRVNAAA